MKSSAKIGNWQEEGALKEMMGDSFDPRDVSSSTLTRYRVVEHKDQITPRNYKSTVQDTYFNPQAHREYLVKDKRGPRERQLDAALRRQVAEEFKQKALEDEAKSNERQFNTTYADAASEIKFKSTLTDYKRNSVVRRPKPLGSRADPAITFYYHTAMNRSTTAFPTSNISTLANPWTKAAATSGGIYLLCVIVVYPHVIIYLCFRYSQWNHSQLRNL
jgi:hypothetical protein